MPRRERLVLQRHHALPDGEPLRAEILTAERLADEARRIASEQAWETPSAARSTPLIGLIERAAASLAQDNGDLVAMVRADIAAPPAAEWLLDNYYLIEEQVLLVREDLPAGYGAELPRLTRGDHQGFPRIYEALEFLVEHTDSRVDEEQLVAFVSAYQEVSPLTIGECWAVPIMLRVAILENLRRLSRAVVATLQAEHRADEWAERLLPAIQDDPDALPDLLARLEREAERAPLPFLIRLAQRLGGFDVAAEPVSRWLEHWLATTGISLEQAAVSEQLTQAANQVSIANAVTTIRFLDALDWRSFFERVSVVEAVLRRDPARTYPVMDFASRDRYRHALEQMAERCDATEIELAETVLALARAALENDPSDEVRGHVGWYLISHGRYELERRVGYRPTIRERTFRGPLRQRGLFYWGSLALFLVILSAGLLLTALAVGAGPAAAGLLVLLGLLPLSEIALTLLNRLASLVFPPRPLPKLDHHEPVSDAHRTLVVVPALLSSVNTTRDVISNLEVAYLANRDPNIGFGLIGDLKAADTERTDADEHIIEAAVRGISELNERYEAEHGRRPFHLLIRRRTYNPSEGSWMGWERKRGALTELVREMRGGQETTFSTKLGDEEFRRTCTFVLTLDADTALPLENARKLICTIAHPLNRARLEPEARIVRAGYGLVQPRVSMSVSGAERSRFAALYSGLVGVDPYANAVSDTYQDVFGEGSFTGKGIFEVDVFERILEGLFPDNTLLSHDLIEGCFVRTGLASDIEVYDDHPANYLAAASRLHRWIRGDWQTLPYLADRIPTASGVTIPNPLSALHRWKILDNLRRSLVPPATMAFIGLGWALLPGPVLWWPVAGFAVILFPAIFAFVDALLSRPGTVPLATTLPGIVSDLKSGTLRQLVALATLPHQAHLALDAASRALWRRFVSHRHLLEWETAADAERRAGTTPEAFWRTMAPGIAASILMLAPALWLEPLRLLTAVPLAVLWLLSPFGVWHLSQPLAERQQPELTEQERLALRRLARKTWRYFDAFVVAQGHHLAPDNIQEDPEGVVAWRTSPTNMGLQLLACLGAWDLGHLTISDLVERVSSTLTAMAGLERYRGHFYNWYDIRTLRPLQPAYVSTVDSGNLAGHLLVLRVGLLEASEAPLLGPQILPGARDAVRLALEDLIGSGDALGPHGAVSRCIGHLEALDRSLALAATPRNVGEWHALLERLSAHTAEALSCLEEISEPAADAEPATMPRAEPDEERPPIPSTPLEQVRASVLDAARSIARPLELLTSLAPWGELLSLAPETVAERPALTPLFRFTPSLVGLAEGLTEALEELDALALAGGPTGKWAARLAAALRAARPRAVELLARLRLNAEIAREMWEHTDFSMLYDERRHLFSIGFNIVQGRLDPSYYDLLASECRLASFLAIAKGDVPPEHWFRLGRALTGGRDGRALVSWSASMFEYLMPTLVMRDWPETLLSETYRTVVKRQIAYASGLGVPWGISESAFNAKDAQLVYQYQAFGVPGLGLKRGLSNDLVIAPYACVLALAFAPREVLTNLEALKAQGAEGRYGLYESLDYTAGRVPAGQTRAIVRAYFAHHQGMIHVALVNAIAGSPMPRRFHADPMVSAAELLLQERVPRNVALVQPHVGEVRELRPIRELPPPVARTYPLASTPVPATHFLSNGRYSVMITNGGGGYSRWRGIAVTRYREDVTRDCWGTFFYVRDVETGETFSAPHNPLPKEPDKYLARFAPDRAEFHRRDGDLETTVDVVVSPEDDVEVRRLTLSNHGLRPRRLEVTSYFEVSLAPQAADQAHKSFSNLFVETEALPDLHAVLFTRRPRSSEEERLWGLHVVACEAQVCDFSFETDRAAFLGRLRNATCPIAVERGGPLGNSFGPVLDPCCALRRTIVIPPGETAHLQYATGIAETREDAVQLAEKYHDLASGQRAVDLAWTASQLELRDLGISPQDAVTIERLASRLLLTDPYSPLKVKTPVENGLRMDGLWSIGISGDYPILLVRVHDITHAPLVRQALLAHQYWRHKGLIADLVILNTLPSGYTSELEERLKLLVRTGHALQMLDRPGGVHIRRTDQIHPDVLNLLLTVARATLDGDGGSLELQLNRRGQRVEPPPPLVPTRAPEPFPPLPFERPRLAYDNGLGGFDLDTGEYVIVLEDGRATPAPWINVFANPGFGGLVSEAGIGCSWALNSHENRITTWNNDPVCDGSGESFYVRDEETGEFWSPTALPIRTPGPYVIRHGHGVTTFEHTTHGIEHRLEWFVAAAEPIRVCRLSLTNRSGRPRRLSVTHLVEWVLGDSRSKAQHLVVTWFDVETDTLTAHNHFNLDFPGRCAFLACDAPLTSWTASRTEFIGRNGSASDPAALHRQHLGGLSGRFHDNCGALQTTVSIAPGETATVSFFLGQTATLEECRELVARYRAPGAVDAALAEVRSSWEELLTAVRVDTPDDRLDLLVNGPLLYQATACRLWGRTAMYQSSGAFGFRDQLQDVLALIIARPSLVREHIVEASRHQFPEGDVLHWWQPYSGRGVRTRISDDRHWLPLAVAEYVDATGDASILDETTAFIEGPPVPEGAEDLYLAPATSEKAASVYEHCVRALESGRPTGAHGLPLIGGGDWNDGMNRVGHEGRGESVWLAWFLAYTLMRFAPICELKGEPERADDYRAWARRLAEAVESTSWDGAWYRRAYFDDGTPLGSSTSEECRIDAIAQAWATISGLADSERAAMALESVDEKLVRQEDGLIALLTPPFDRMPHDPGYIKGYVPGVRENGGQYTHAALWVVLAQLMRGNGDEGAALLGLINPIRHALDETGVERYKVEPYVVAADVYAAPPHTGRGGWTWYTGSAAWFYRVAVHHLLGISVKGREGRRYLVIDPCIPKHWHGFTAVVRVDGSTYRIRVDNPRGVNRGVARVTLDGEPVPGTAVEILPDSGEHSVVVTMLSA